MAAAVELARGTGPAPHEEPARAASHSDPSLHALVAKAHGDPHAIAAELARTGRDRDPHVWTELQQTLGNAKTAEVRAAVPASGAAHAPDAKQPAVPADGTYPEQIEREVLGVIITAPAGTRVAAMTEVARIVQTEIGKNQYAQQQFAKSKVSIVIIPAHEQMTQMPEFAHLQGKKTFDGRDWSGVRGMGGTRTPNGRFSIAVAEEGLTAVPDVKNKYPATYSVTMHELAHVLESHGMTPAQQARIKQLYAQHLAKDPGDKAGTFTDRYGAANEQEYFAQSTNAYFGRNVMDKNHSGKPWLAQHDPDMYAFLVELYDKPHGAAAAP